MTKPRSVDEYVENQSKFKTLISSIRKIILSRNLDEQIKWNFPTYFENKNNIVAIGSTKQFVGIWFFQGVFLKDEHQKLVNAQEGKTKAMRQWRIFNDQDFNPLVFENYLDEAIQNSRDGLKIKPERTKDIDIPEYLKNALEYNSDLQASFDNLTFGRKKEIAEYISSAKREKTKQSRLEKCIPLIFAGLSPNDKYRK